MTTHIKEAFNKLNIKITTKMISNFLDIVAGWENRKENPLVLHGQLIGVYKIFFFGADRDQLFHLVGLEEKDIQILVKSIPSIEQRFNVISDPFNLLTMWLIHLSESQISNKKLRDQFKLALCKYIHYKFFTSLTHRQFPHTVDEGVMIATIMDLSKKYDIVKYGSWFKTIEARCLDMISDHSIHKQTFVTAEDDDKFTYLIVDAFNRMSAKIVLIANMFYHHHGHGIAIKGTGSTMTDAEGEKILIEKSSTIAMAESRLTRDVLNINAWVSNSAIQAVGSQFPAISNNLLKIALTQMSGLASMQFKTKKFSPRETINGEMIIVGQAELIRHIVTTSAAITVKEGIILSNRVQAWKGLRNAFTSSRTLDPDILLVKASVAHFVDNLGSVSREATKVSLRTALTMYVVYRFILLMK